MRRSTSIAAAVVPLLVLLLPGCGTEDGAEGTTSDGPTSSSPSTTATSSPTSTQVPVAPDVVDVPTLARGPELTADHAIDGRVRFDGRTLETDLPEGAGVSIMGSVDGLVVLQGSSADAAGGQFWSVDADGHAEELGDGDYETYNYAPVLVEETGHIWVNYDDRGTLAKRVWEIDVRTGAELLELVDGAEPPELAPADRAVFDLFSGNGGEPAAPTPSTSPDGSLEVRLRDVIEDGESRYTVVVRRTSDDSVVRRVTLPLGIEVSDHEERLTTCTAPPRRGCYVYVGVGEPQFEDDGHVVFVVDVYTADTNGLTESVGDSWVVRCDLDDACELATDSTDSVSLGVHPGL